MVQMHMIVLLTTMKIKARKIKYHISAISNILKDSVDEKSHS